MDLQCTTLGHYSIPINEMANERPSYMMLTMKNVQKQIILKLHKQFAHPNGLYLMILLKGRWVCFVCVCDDYEDFTKNSHL